MCSAPPRVATGRRRGYRQERYLCFESRAPTRRAVSLPGSFAAGSCQFLPLRTAAKLGTPRRYRQTSFCWMAKGSRARLRRTLLLGAPIASKKSSSLPRRMVASRGLTVERGVRVSHWNFVCDNNELCRCRDEWPKRLLRGGGSQHTGRWYRLGISHPEPFADQEGPRRPVVRRRVMSEHGRLCRY